MSDDPQNPNRSELGDLFAAAMRRLVARSRAEVGKAARSGKQRLEVRQLQKDLDHFWVRLGKTAYHLVRGGEIDHPALQRAMARIDELEAQIDELRRSTPSLTDTEGPADEPG